MSIFSIARLRPIPLVAIRRGQRVRSQAALATKQNTKSRIRGAVAAYLAETGAEKPDRARRSKSGAAAAITTTRAATQGVRIVTEKQKLMVQGERQLDPVKPLTSG